jgi:hypothetical protein
MKRNNDPRYYLQNKEKEKRILQKQFIHKMIEEQINTLKKYVIIHPTKVAGSAFIKYVQANYSAHFKYNGHEFKAVQAVNPIVFIRDPYDRFISIYKYWKYGSLDYNNHKHNETHLINMQKYNIKDFIRFVKKKDPILITSFTSHTHIRTQTWWINEEDYKKSIIVYYDKNEMEKKIFQLFDYLEQLNICKNLKIPFQKINVSNSNNNEKIILDESDKMEINQIYKADFDLISKIKMYPQIFKKVF